MWIIYFYAFFCEYIHFDHLHPARQHQHLYYIISYLSDKIKYIACKYIDFYPCRNRFRFVDNSCSFCYNIYIGDAVHRCSETPVSIYVYCDKGG